MEFIKVLAKWKIKISLDSKSAWRDNIVVERLWRTNKYKLVYPRADGNVPEARALLGCYVICYNGRRTHSSLDGKPLCKAHVNLLTPLYQIPLISTYVPIHVGRWT